MHGFQQTSLAEANINKPSYWLILSEILEDIARNKKHWAIV